MMHSLRTLTHIANECHLFWHEILHQTMYGSQDQTHNQIVKEKRRNIGSQENHPLLVNAS